MKKPLYITVLTAFAMVNYLPNITDMNFVFIPLIWLADIAVLFVGELLGTRIGRRSRFGEKWGANIGAGISAAVLFAVYAFIVLIIPGDLDDLREYAAGVWYYPIGAAAVRALVMNAGNIAAKKIVTFYARHGAPPSPDLTLKKFLPRLFIMAGTSVACAASVVIFFMMGKYSEIPFRLIEEALFVALYIQVAFLIGAFVNLLAEKPLAVNITIAAMAVWLVIPKVRFLSGERSPDAYYPDYYLKTETTVAKIMIGFWAAVLIADIVWAVVKLRKNKRDKGFITQ